MEECGKNNVAKSGDIKSHNKELDQPPQNGVEQAVSPQNAGVQENPALSDDKQVDIIVGMEQRIKALEEEKASLSDRLLRVYADFDNFRKRVAKESAEIEAKVAENIFTTLLPVADNAAHAIDSIGEKELENEKIKGFKSIIDDLLKTFEKLGLLIEKPDKGIFDPKRHEAVAVVPSEEVEENHIVKLFRPGYLLKNKTIRPAQVIVSSGKSGHKKHHTKDEQKHEPSSDKGQNDNLKK